MRLTPEQRRLVEDAVARVRAAWAKGDKRISLDPPAAWTLGDAAWENDVVAELKRTGKIERILRQ